MPEYKLEDIWKRTKKFVDLKKLRKQKNLGEWKKEFTKSIQEKTGKGYSETAKNLGKVPGFKEKAFVYQSGFSRQRTKQRIAVVSKKYGTRVFVEKNVRTTINLRKAGETTRQAIYFYNIRLKKRLTWGFID